MEVDMLSLSTYLDLAPQAAMIFTSEGGTFSADSLQVCYVNRAFLESIGDSPLADPEDEEGEVAPELSPPPTDNRAPVAANFMSILQTQCINPSASHFIQWVNGVAQEPEIVHYLKTRFKGFTLAKEEYASERTPQFVDIEWNAVVMKKKFIVLSGRRTGTVQFSAVQPQVDPILPGDLMGSAIEEEEEEEKNKEDEAEGTRADKPVSSSSSSSTNSSNARRPRRSGTARQSSSTTLSERSRTGSLKAGSDTSEESEGRKWRHTEKFVKAMGGDSVMGKLLREKDWSKTEFGAMTKWNQTLITMVSLIMSSSHPMSLWLGKDLTLIYNDGYIPIAGARHPQAFGQPARTFWPELFPQLDPLIEDVFQGNGVYSEDAQLIMERNGYTEETYFTWSYVPIPDPSGEIMGFLNRIFLQELYSSQACYESTERILAERRLKTLRELDTQSTIARSMSDLGKCINTAFTFNPYDVPFALVYFCNTEYGTSLLAGGTGGTRSTERTRKSSLHSSSATGTEKTDPAVWAYHLQDVVGIPHGHNLAPETVEIHLNEMDQDEVHLWPFRKMAQEQKAIDIPNVSAEALEGITPQGWPELPSHAVAVPIVGARDHEGKDIMMGMLIIGTNPRRDFDETYETFAAMCGRQIAAAMTLVRNIEQETARAEELAALNRDRTSFFNSVSHELRTPLTLILGPLEECIDDPSLSQQHKGRLDIVGRNARRLLRLVNSLLDFSRVEAGKMACSFRETDLQKLTADLASLFRSAIEKGGVKYTVDVSGKARPVWIDRDMWEKIVFNIIGNAFKFTLSGHITVTCCLADDGRHMVFSTADSGSGIPPHEINRVFDRFHRVHDQKGRSYEGTGIGLSLTQELVKLHGGKLEVESTYGLGTTFTIQIPVGNSHLPQDQLVRGDELMPIQTERSYGQSMIEEAGRWAIRESAEDRAEGRAMSTASSDSNSTVALQTAQWVPISSRGSRVLIADDNEDMRRYLRGVLLQFYEVIEAANGQEALALAIQEKPDLILTDIMMPELSGYGFLKVIRSSPETRSTPFILLTARAGDEARVEGLLAGADDYLAKPFHARELVARVHTHLDIARMRVELERRVVERTKDLTESEERYRILSAISPVGIFRIDFHGVITYANSKWREITGTEERLENDSAGQTFLSAVHPDDRESLRESLRGAMEDTDKCTFEVRWGTADSFRWAMGEIVPEIISENVLGFIGVLTDVTERRQMEAEKLDAAEEVRSQQELAIDVICHELRNPLNGIYHNADIVSESMTSIREEVLKFRDDLFRTHKTNELADIEYSYQDSQTIAHLVDFLDTELAQDLESIESLTLCAKHQKRIADDVLQMSKLSMNLVSLTITQFDPLQETRNVIRMFEREAFVKNIAFKFTVGSGYQDLQVGWVSADPIRYSQVLLNFISNAVRFTEKAPIREIEIGLDASEMEPQFSHPLFGNNDASRPALDTFADENHRLYLIASVADSGVGLTPEERANLFQKFAQASPRTHIEYGGSGLGLFISKSLVEVQGGRISLESQKDKGTTLTFYIQATQVATPINSTAPSTTSRSVSPRILTPRIKRSSSSSASIPQQKAIRVLVVEDNLKVLTRQLQLAGFKTGVANHGVECLEILDSAADPKEKFDIILMDLEMPIMNGIVATEEIREREASGKLSDRIPIIAVTGNARAGYMDKASQIGIDSFIVKPYEKQDLIEKIRTLVG